MRDAVRDLLGEVSTLAAGVALGIPAYNLASALGSYTGIKRRLQLKGEAAGVQVIDSYAGWPWGTAVNAKPVIVGPGQVVGAPG